MASIDFRLRSPGDSPRSTPLLPRSASEGTAHAALQPPAPVERVEQDKLPLSDAPHTQQAGSIERPPFTMHDPRVIDAMLAAQAWIDGKPEVPSTAALENMAFTVRMLRASIAWVGEHPADDAAGKLEDTGIVALGRTIISDLEAVQKEAAVFKAPLGDPRMERASRLVNDWLAGHLKRPVTDDDLADVTHATGEIEKGRVQLAGDPSRNVMVDERPLTDVSRDMLQMYQGFVNAHRSKRCTVH